MGLTEPLTRTLRTKTGGEKRGRSAEQWANGQPRGGIAEQRAVHSQGRRGDESRPRTPCGAPPEKKECLI